MFGDAVYFGWLMPKFRRTFVPPHRTNGNTRFLRNGRPALPNCTILHPTRQQCADVTDTCVLLLRMKQHLIMCKYTTLCFACCFMAEEKGTECVTTLNRLIKANKRHMWGPSCNNRALLMAHCADFYISTAGCCSRGTELSTVVKF